MEGIEKEAALEKLLARLMNEPLAAERQEFGKMLMTHIEDFTPKERKRYDELNAMLTKSNSTNN